MAEEELCFELGAGAGGDVEKAQVLDRGSALVAFCDIAGDGARGLSELGGEAVAFLGGQALCRSIDVETELESLLPDDEVLERLDLGR